MQTKTFSPLNWRRRRAALLGAAAAALLLPAAAQATLVTPHEEKAQVVTPHAVTAPPPSDAGTPSSGGSTGNPSGPSITAAPPTTSAPPSSPGRAPTAPPPPGHQTFVPTTRPGSGQTVLPNPNLTPTQQADQLQRDREVSDWLDEQEALDPFRDFLEVLVGPMPVIVPETIADVVDGGIFGGTTVVVPGGQRPGAAQNQANGEEVPTPEPNAVDIAVEVISDLFDLGGGGEATLLTQIDEVEK